MYNKDEMTTLHSAYDCKSVADSAEYEHEIEALAFCINNAANTGEYKATYLSPISDAAMQELTDKGYQVTYNGGADKESSILISWREA